MKPICGITVARKRDRQGKEGKVRQQKNKILVYTIRLDVLLLTTIFGSFVHVLTCYKFHCRVHAGPGCVIPIVTHISVYLGK